MKPFSEFLAERRGQGPLTTEDALACFLPLLRQVAEAHALGMAAPLCGTDALRVERSAIWFQDSDRKPQAANAEALRRIDPPEARTFEVVSERKRDMDLDSGGNPGEAADLSMGIPGAEITRPVYLPAYGSWEHAVGHHDPQADIFSLGLILASLSCNLDLNRDEDLLAFVRGRANLFSINPGLHPVIARVVAGMTELSRHRRLRDLGAIRSALENYRDRQAGLDYDLGAVKGFREKDRRGKRAVILARLKERLFELSRRNRLLHFRDTTGTLCLTEASVPLSMDLANVRQEQILTWGGEFADSLSRGKAVSLNRHIDFREALYAAPSLDRIRAETQKDQAEYGFRHQRLVLCFLRWADLKADPPEHYFSPLVLLPVNLAKKKGVRDTYVLEPAADEAEINPVLKHLFKKLYGINLPDGIDLAEAKVQDLHSALEKAIRSSEPSVELKLVDRPRIDLVHERARRRLDLYRRRARVTGKGAGSFMSVDYSYDPANFHPLGLALFNERVRPAGSLLGGILREKPVGRHFARPGEDPPESAREKTFFSLHDAAKGNPYAWEFDLCRVTLGNFRYRKMTLVRDYEELIESDAVTPAFEAAFSLEPKPIEEGDPRAPEHSDRFDVVPCDPAQAVAIGLARKGKSYIVQGPPGTGKSQTITNLIADFAARGKSVLFVCEKRAALDVVYLRLRQRGLGGLCCLIHDSQADKKGFVSDLKETYESMLEAAKKGLGQGSAKRRMLDAAFEEESRCLGEFARLMKTSFDETGAPLLAMLERGIALGPAMALGAAGEEKVPFFSAWARNRAALAAFEERLKAVQPDSVFARHPLRFLKASVADLERPIERVSALLDAAEPAAAALRDALALSGLKDGSARTFGGLKALVEAAARAEPLARRGLMGLLSESSGTSLKLAGQLLRLKAAESEKAEAEAGATNWSRPLSPEDTEAALARARGYGDSVLNFLRPGWWALRKVMNSSYDFGARAVRPTWTAVLEALRRLHEARARAKRLEADLAMAMGVEGGVRGILDLAEALKEELKSSTAGADALAMLVSSAKPDEAAARLAPRAREAAELSAALEGFMEAPGGIPSEGLADALMGVREVLDELPAFCLCLREMGKLPPSMAGALRELPCTPRELEAAAIGRTFGHLARLHPAITRLDSRGREEASSRLLAAHERWMELNSELILENVTRGLVEDLRISSAPAAGLKPAEEEFKNRFNRGRRDLEHEFGKTMRYKPIREIVSGDTGMVVEHLKPVWLMSPLSVSDTLPLDGGRFDVVIFDEASQITLEEAVPALFRSGQAIVVGDEKQLPPTSFFAARGGEEEEEGAEAGGDGGVAGCDLGVNSFLDHAARNLSSRMLRWHYRSKSESLIGFSNWAFYDGRLLTVPDEELPGPGAGEIEVVSASEGGERAKDLLSRPLSFHFAKEAVYENRRNRMEADYIAHLVRGLLAAEGRPTIGVVAFSEAQQGEIEDALERLAVGDPAFRDALEAEYVREDDGQFTGLLVKNLENIQGDERDVIVLSTCYGPGPDGRTLMNFGPINQGGGEKRLNVAFSRSRRHMAVVSSIRADDITNDYNDGANCLKRYLRYASACSAGSAESARGVLREMCPWREDSREDQVVRSGALARAVTAALKSRGYEVDHSVGMSDFRCDLAVRAEGDRAYRLGILLDTGRHYEEENVLEREVSRPRLLGLFGWRILRVTAAEWYADPAAACAGMLAVLEGGAGAGKMEPHRGFSADLGHRLASAGGDGASGSGAGEEEDGPEPPACDAQPAWQDAGLEENVPSYFEYIDGKSAKFWEITWSGSRYSVRFGRIGTAGQEHLKAFRDSETAMREAARAVFSKIRGGYAEKRAGR